eukprot:Partr_v1_DN25894_c0_g1_i1_m2780 putative NA
MFNSQQQSQTPQPASSFSFGASTNSSTAKPSMFGSTTTTPAATNAGGLFGSQPATAASGTGLFGQTTATGTGGGLFGSTQPQQQQQQQPSTTSTLNFGQSQPASTASGGLFGGQTSSASNLGGGLFGQSTAQPQQQQPQQQQQSKSLFGGTFGSTASTQPAATGGLFGSSSAAAPTLGLGSTQAPATTASFNIQSLNKSTRYNDLPAEIQRKLDEFNKVISDQTHMADSLDISFTGDTIRQVGKEIDKVLERQSHLKNSLVRDSHQINAIIKDRSNKHVDHVEMARRLFDIMMKHGGPGSIGIAERPFYHAQDYVFKYFCDVVSALENRLGSYTVTLDDLERLLSSSKSSSANSPSAIGDILRNNYSAFIALSSNVATLHDEVEREKHQYLRWRRTALNDDRNPFEQKSTARPSNTQTAVPFAPSASVGPQPVGEKRKDTSSLGTFGASLAPNHRFK